MTGYPTRVLFTSNVWALWVECRRGKVRYVLNRWPFAHAPMVPLYPTRDEARDLLRRVAG